VIRDGKTVSVGSFVFRKRFKGVGEIRIQSGTTDHKTFKQYEAAVESLYDSGTVDALIALKERRCTLREIHAWWRDRTLTPPWSEDRTSHEPLFRTLREWIESADTKSRLQPTTRSGYKKCIKMIEVSCKMRDASVQNIQEALAQYRIFCATATPPKVRSFNQGRAMILSFLRQTETTSSHLYQNTRSVEVITESPWTKKTKNKPLLPSEIDAAFGGVSDRRLHDVVWFLATTGMTPKEFLEDGWEIDETINAIRIFGRKRAGRYGRIVPRLYQKLAAHKDWNYRQLLEAFKQVFPTRSLYDLRRTFAVWNNRAGIDALHTKAYMGHGANITERYMAQNVASWLMEDATKLNDYIARSRCEAATISDKRITLPDNPEQLTRTLQDERLEYFTKLLDDQLAKWYSEGQMRHLYKVGRLIASESLSAKKQHAAPRIEVQKTAVSVQNRKANRKPSPVTSKQKRIARTEGNLRDDE